MNEQTKTFEPGQRVIRYMGVAGGFWEGHVLAVIDARNIRVAFGMRQDRNGETHYDMSMPFEVDQCLLPYPETAEDLDSLRATILEQRKKDAPLNAALDSPLWPKGYFGKLEGESQ